MHAVLITQRAQHLLIKEHTLHGTGLPNMIYHLGYMPRIKG